MCSSGCTREVQFSTYAEHGDGAGSHRWRARHARLGWRRHTHGHPRIWPSTWNHSTRPMGRGVIFSNHCSIDFRPIARHPHMLSVPRTATAEMSRTCQSSDGRNARPGAGAVWWHSGGVGQHLADVRWAPGLIVERESDSEDASLATTSQFFAGKIPTKTHHLPRNLSLQVVSNYLYGW